VRRHVEDAFQVAWRGATGGIWTEAIAIGTTRSLFVVLDGRLVASDDAARFQVRVHNFSITLDGFGTGDGPLGSVELRETSVSWGGGTNTSCQ
jgi:hypothetical protein